MALRRTTAAPDSQAPDHETKRAPWGNRVFTILLIVVAIETVLVLGLAVTVGYLCGERSSSPEGMIESPSAEQQEIWMLADQMGSDVGYLIMDNDLEAYLDLYDPADTHVDMASVESDFTSAAQKAQQAQDAVTYVTNSMPIVYEDVSTGETIARVSVSGTNMQGVPAGGRVTIFVAFNNGEMTLTGREGRELKVLGTLL
jgi:hypothetical protein